MAHAPPAAVRKRKQSHEQQDIHKFQGKESILTSQIELYIEDVKPTIPDGGWGWMIVLACFFLNGISEGISFSFGLLYIEFLHEFGSSKSATSWVGSLFLAMPLLAGPIGSAMVDRYGCISMTVMGSLISTVGFILSTYVSSLSMLYVTFGIIGGIGRALTYVTAVVSIAFWFEKKRAIALGIAASGTGVGTVAFAPLTTLCIFEYGWRGTVLLLAGCLLNMSVCGVLMRDPKWIQDQHRVKKTARKATKKRTKIPIETTMSGKRDNPQLVLQRVSTSLDLTEKDRFRSAIDLPTFVKENEKLPLEVINRLSENKQLYKIILENYPNFSKRSASNQDIHVHELGINSRIPVKFSMRIKKTEFVIPEEDEEEEEDELESQSESDHEARLLYRVPEVPIRHQPHSYLDVMTMSSPDLYKAFRNTNVDTPVENEKWYVKFFKPIKGLLNFSLFLELHFLLLSLSTTVLYVWFIVPYFYVAEHMTKIGYTDSQASSVLSAIGFTNTIGMVFLGWAGEKLNIAKTYAVCIIVCGISVACIIWFSGSYIGLLIVCAIFGLFFASCFSLLPSLLGELVPLEDFTMAYGLILLCMGVGNLGGPPLAGFLFDLTKSWNLSFYQAAGWIIFSGILIGIIPFTKNRKIIGTGPVLNDQ